MNAIVVLRINFYRRIEGKNAENKSSLQNNSNYDTSQEMVMDTISRTIYFK